MGLLNFKTGSRHCARVFQLLLDVLLEKDKHCCFIPACSYAFCDLKKKSSSSNTCSLEFPSEKMKL